MLNEIDLYRQIIAISSRSFHTCFYCGCVANRQDLIPSLKYAEFYLKTREDADFYSVPCCQECYEFGKDDRSSILGLRADYVKKRLAHKYRKAIRVYEMWEQDELNELDYALKKSINAGLKLGKESYDRIKYRGFEFECDGQKHMLYYVKREELSVFGDKFDNFKDALDYASKAYRIPKAKLKDMFADNNNSFDAAIRQFHAEMEKKLYEKELKEKCKVFASEYKKNVDFVIRTVEYFMKEDKNLTITTALQKLYKQRVATNEQESIIAL